MQEEELLKKQTEDLLVSLLRTAGEISDITEPFKTVFGGRSCPVDRKRLLRTILDRSEYRKVPSFLL